MSYYPIPKNAVDHQDLYWYNHKRTRGLGYHLMHIATNLLLRTIEGIPTMYDITVQGVSYFDLARTRFKSLQLGQGKIIHIYTL